jgi:hypothetical protein
MHEERMQLGTIQHVSGQPASTGATQRDPYRGPNVLLLHARSRLAMAKQQKCNADHSTGAEHGRTKTINMSFLQETSLRC